MGNWREKGTTGGSNIRLNMAVRGEGEEEGKMEEEDVGVRSLSFFFLGSDASKFVEVGLQQELAQ